MSIESLYNNEWALKNRKINCKSTISIGYFDILQKIFFFYLLAIAFKGSIGGFILIEFPNEFGVQKVTFLPNVVTKGSSVQNPRILISNIKPGQYLITAKWSIIFFLLLKVR